jgi:PilZ domain
MFSSKSKRDVRKKRRHGAWITFDNDIRSYECQVLDVSPGGAKLVADIDALVGASFRLSVAPDSLVRKPCEVVWRRGRQIGVKFKDEAPGLTLPKG